MIEVESLHLTTIATKKLSAAIILALKITQISKIISKIIKEKVEVNGMIGRQLSYY